MQPQASTNNLYLRIMICVLLSGAVLAIYLQAVHFDFVYLDDLQFVVNNPHLAEGFSAGNLLWAFGASTDVSKYYIPVTWLSFILDHTLYGLNPGGFHLTNILLHLGNAVLLYLALCRFTKRCYLSAVVAGLFAVHPLHVESVAWISERKDVLSTFFFMLTILSYHTYIKRPCRHTYLVVTLFFLLALLSKPMMVTLPLVMLLIDIWPARRVRFDDAPLQSQRPVLLRLAMEKVPFFIIIIVFSMMAYITQKKGHAVIPFSLYPLQMRLENMFVAYWVYLKKMLWPTDLAVHYPYPGKTSLWTVIPAVAAFAAACVMSVRSLRRHPFLTVGWWWFVITLFPVIGIIVIGPYLIADRYAYISLIGIYVLITWGVAAFITRFPRLKPIFITATALFLVGFSILAWTQVKHWENSETLFLRALFIDPQNSVAHHNLATYYHNHQAYGRAVQHYRAAVHISPTYTEAYFNLGNTYFKLGRYREARDSYRRVTELNPNHAPAFNRLGIACRYLSDFDEAIRAFETALAIDPYYASAHNNLKRIRAEKDATQGH
jgi:protein O-mannosyl-transferase